MKTIGSLRIEERTINHMKKAIEKYNKKNLINISESEFRRIAIELFSQMLLQDIKIPIEIKD